MVILYKTFAKARTALSVLGTCFFMLLTVPSTAQAFVESLFAVDNVTVDITAENALKAREQAFEEAQVKAFDILAARMLSENELKTFERPPVMSISTMIKDYEVSNEKLSSKRYIGTYKFRFEDRSVKRYFSGQGAQYTDVVSKPVLILPFLETGQGTILWSYQNVWMQAWSTVPDLSSGLVPLVVPLGDLGDVSDIGDDEALTYSRRALDNMLRRYDASEAVIAIAKAEGTALNVQLYRTDRTQPEYVHQIFERALPGQDPNQIYIRAVQSVKQVLRSDWKKKTVVDARQHGTIEARVSFASLQEWSDLQRRLQRVNGVSNIALKALSLKEACVEITFDGTIERLKLALEQADLYLNERRMQNNTGSMNTDYSQGMHGGFLDGNDKKVQTVYELTTRHMPQAAPYQEPSYQTPLRPNTPYPRPDNNAGQNQGQPYYQSQF
ncbi:MAG TPA: DUF2066 domain-containing protein [Alphaproteobacteria bacterium]|nr:DUF2066 domain-containing protein [Alphaproteobacteria bacterium]USO04890.1 MAG: DUF2066 domain-containing protein [Rhodospirillales bacterium]HOO82778.1 DUF2066 domain-containing protein [Alphaproteobacteria bacterium]